MYEELAIFSAIVFLYSIASGRLDRTPINGAIVYTGAGLIFGSFGLGFLNLDVGSEGLSTLAELTLALVLFTDAANADMSVLRKSFLIPQRMLLFGLPLTILFGFGLGVLLFGGLTLVEVAILATVLAPTDAALGKAVVTNESVPANIREGLNVESGLNDGVCVPILFLFLSLATGSNIQGGTTSLALKLVAEEIGIGVAVGGGLTLLGGWLIKLSTNRGWVAKSWRQASVGALALACFALAQKLGGSGFIACFCGGLLFGGVVKDYKETFLLAAEGTSDILAMITWMIFGGAIVGEYIGNFSWQVVLYAVLSLTIVRMLPIFLSLAGMKLRTDEKLFMGWFGPRGLASIVFGVIVLNAHLPGGNTITVTVVCTIILSVLAHGLSANPLVARLVARLNRVPRLKSGY
ncbi:MAG: cation:proton antiporter [Thermodesulfobacteriota bacterium]